MKMPAPMIPPITNMVASNSPSLRASRGSECVSEMTASLITSQTCGYLIECFYHYIIRLDNLNQITGKCGIRDEDEVKGNNLLS